MALIFLFVDEQERIFEGGFHAFGVGDEVGGNVPAVELHAFDHVQRGAHGFGFLNGNDAVFADLVHGFGNQVADGGVVVRGNGADLPDLFLVLTGLAELLQFSGGRFNGFLDSAFQFHGIRAGAEVLHAFAENGLGQHRGGCGAVTGHVAGFAGHFLDQLGSHILVGVLEIDFLGDGHAVLGDRGGAEFLVQNGVPAFGAQRGLDGIGQLVHALENRAPGLITIQ